MGKPCKNYQMKPNPNTLRLQDFKPKETTFKLGDFPDRDFTLCRWTLRVRMWALENYTSEQLKVIFENQQINDIAVISYFMLKEKDVFPTQDSFLDAISTIQDQINVIMAMLGSLGIGEPEVQKIVDAIEKEAPVDPKPKSANPKTKIGAKSSTP